MANKKVKKSANKKTTNENPAQALNQPWITMKNGLVVITITSLFMAILTGIQVYPAGGLGQAILWGLIFGGLIWVIFWGYYFFRRFLGRFQNRKD